MSKKLDQKATAATQNTHKQNKTAPHPTPRRTVVPTAVGSLVSRVLPGAHQCQDQDDQDESASWSPLLFSGDVPAAGQDKGDDGGGGQAVIYPAP